MATDAADSRRQTAILAPGDLRKKNQITIPKSVTVALGLHPGDRVLFVVEEGESGGARLYRMPQSFAGAAPHAYGGRKSGVAYVNAERESWEE